MERSEEALMMAYVAGDRVAFTGLFERLAPSILAFFARSLGSRSLAEDLVQTTFLKLHGARASWLPDRPLRPWVFAIAARVRQDALRRARRLPVSATEAEITAAEQGAASGAEVPAQEAALMGRDVGDRVRRALDLLPESQRIVIHLNRFEGLELAEIAGVLGTTEGAVKLRAFRGYARLRTLLADVLREEP